MQFSIKIGNMELRSCGEVEHLSTEIVMWQTTEEPSCYTIAQYHQTKDGFSLHFVGGRPFAMKIDPKIFMFLAKRGQELLEESLITNST